MNQRQPTTWPNVAIILGLFALIGWITTSCIGALS